MTDQPRGLPRLTDVATMAGYRLGALASQLTPSVVGQGAAALAGAMVAPMSAKREMVIRHQRRVNPHLGRLALERKAQLAYESYARYYVESMRLPGMSSRAVDRGMSTQGYREYIRPALAAGTGAILALPHLGGWEWGGRWIVDQGHEMTVVVEPLANREVFEWFVDLRERLGMHIVPLGPDAAAACSKALKDNHVLCLLCDRDIGGGGIEVEFFGERTTLPAGPAMLGLRTGAPILPSAVYYTDRTTGHLGYVLPPLDATRRDGLRADVARVTQDLAGALEHLIRRSPEQWHLFQPNWPSDSGYGT